jgi:hypothetical protein
LGYFEKGIEAKQKVAYMGDKTFIYMRGDSRNQASFNWSDRREARELTRIFQAIAATLEAGRRLAFLRKYEKLGLDQELKAMEKTYASKAPGLEELYSIAPVLREIIDDRGVMRMARERARRLLAIAEQGSSS